MYFEPSTVYSTMACSTIQSGVPQVSDHSPPDLFGIYSADIPNKAKTIMAKYAENTATLSPGNNPVLTSKALQNHLNLIENWSSKW